MTCTSREFTVQCQWAHRGARTWLWLPCLLSRGTCRDAHVDAEALRASVKLMSDLARLTELRDIQVEPQGHGISAAVVNEPSALGARP